MSSAKKNSLVKHIIENPSPRRVSVTNSYPEIALAAISSSKKQKEVGEFISYILTALERHSNWLNNIFNKQTEFKCALLVGAGPNRFEIQETIYPPGEKEVSLEVELKDSDDHDKIAIAALLKLSNSELFVLMDYIKNHLSDNSKIRDDLLKGKALGISFAILRSITDKQYRLTERIVIGNSLRAVAASKRAKEDKLIVRSLKKAKRVA